MCDFDTQVGALIADELIIQCELNTPGMADMFFHLGFYNVFDPSQYQRDPFPQKSKIKNSPFPCPHTVRIYSKQLMCVIMDIFDRCGTSRTCVIIDICFSPTFGNRTSLAFLAVFNI